MKLNQRLLTAMAATALIGAAGQTVAGTAPKEVVTDEVPVETKTESLFDRIWSVADLYKDDSNPFIQELSLTGRQQNEYYYFDASQGTADGWVNRRTRIGLKGRFFNDYILHGEVDLDLQNRNPVYNKLTDAYLQWAPSSAFALTMGKHGAKFTLDGHTSSTRLFTMDRSNIANNFWFPEEYVPGVSVSGKAGNWLYNVGYFSSGEATSEFGEFNAGSFALLNLGYDMSKALNLDRALLRTDFVYQDPNPGNTFTRQNEMVGSINMVLEQGRFGLGTDLVGAKGYLGQPDLFGLQFMPSMYLNESKTLQAVFRYLHINSRGDRGIRFARYENQIAPGRGDEYNEFYLGLNYYLYGHKLKLQTGVQYTDMSDRTDSGGNYDGWGVTTGLRVSW